MPIEYSKDAVPKPQRDRIFGHVVWILALWAGLLNLLNFNQYPLLTTEVALGFLCLAVIGAIMALITQITSTVVKYVFASLFATIIIDLNFSIEPLYFIIIWVAFAAVMAFAYEAFITILVTASASVILFQSLNVTISSSDVEHRPDVVAQTLQKPSHPPSDRPAIVHLVFDSYLGLDGMALGPQYYRDLRTEQISFFADHGFQVYPRAYSRHAKTLNSLPALFSYGEHGTAKPNGGVRQVTSDRLPYFNDLYKRGYRVSAALPAYFDLCADQRLSQCHTFESSALTSMLGTEMNARERTKIFGFTLLNLSGTVRIISRSLEIFSEEYMNTKARYMHNRSQLFPLASSKHLDRFIADLPTIRRGEMRFAHMLLPHDPYILSADCSVKPESEWLDEHGPGAVSAREQAYADHVRCLQSRIDDLLDTLDSTEAGREAIVLLHGDHGSRIAPSQPFVDGPQLSRREQLMAFSTLYAVRVPGEPAAEIAGTYALDELMADFRNRDFASAPRPQQVTPRVAFIDPYGIPKKWHDLPSFEH